MHTASYDQIERFRNRYLNIYDKLNILDIGAADVNGSYKPLFNTYNWKYTGADIEKGSGVDLIIDYIETESAGDNLWDIIISGQCLEHVEYPWLMMEYIYKSLKPRGMCCIIVPSAGGEHRFPIDCYRFFPDGMNALGAWAGFKTLECFRPKNITYTNGGKKWHDTVFIGLKP